MGRREWEGEEEAMYTFANLSADASPEVGGSKEADVQSIGLQYPIIRTARSSSRTSSWRVLEVRWVPKRRQLSQFATLRSQCAAAVLTLS